MADQTSGAESDGTHTTSTPTPTGSLATQGAAFDIERWWQKRDLADRAPIAVSPGGEWLAVTLHGLMREGQQGSGVHPREGGVFEVAWEGMAGSEVVLVERATGKVSRPFRAFVGSFTPVWQPGGTRLLLAVQDAPTRFPRLAVWSPGDEAPRIFGDAAIKPKVGFTTPAWTADGTQVVFMRRNPQTPAPARITQTTINSDGTVTSKTRPVFLETIGVVDVASGQVREYPQVREACVTAWGFRLSPDGKKVALSGHAEGGTPGVQANWSKLTILTLDSGAVQTLGDEPQAECWGLGSSWSPDGRHIAWRIAPSQVPEKLFIADVDDSRLREVALPEDAKDGYLFSVGQAPAAPPLWTRDSSGFWLPGKNALLHFGLNGALLGQITLPGGGGGGDQPGGIDWLDNAWPPSASVTTQALPEDGDLFVVRKRAIERVNVAKQSVETVVANPGATGAGLTHDWSERAYHAPSATLFTVRSTEDDGIELLQTNLRDAKTSRLTLLCEGPGKVAYGQTRSLSWKLADGTACGGTLLLPPGWKEGETPPVMMDLYGDIRGRGSLSLAALHNASNVIDPHLLGVHGFAFFRPDVPQTDEEPAASLVRSAQAAADALGGSGLVDPERIGIMGQSYGGYTVLCVVTATPRFRCGIAACGIYDLPKHMFIGGSGYVEGGQGRMRCSLWDRPQRYLDNSPIYALNKLATPLLVIQGDADNWSKEQGNGLFCALQRLAKPSEYINGAEMGHVPTCWTIEAQRELIPRVLEFLVSNLKG